MYFVLVLLSLFSFNIQAVHAEANVDALSIKSCNEECIEGDILNSDTLLMPDQIQILQSRYGVSTITKEYLDQLFDYIAQYRVIPHEYIYNGCYARAHKVGQVLGKENVQIGKIFAKGRLFSRTGAVIWSYHVASTIIVRNGSSELVYVIDPSLARKPLRAEQWIKLMIKHSGSRLDQVYFSSRYHYSLTDQLMDVRGHQAYFEKNMEETLAKMRAGKE